MRLEKLTKKDSLYVSDNPRGYHMVVEIEWKIELGKSIYNLLYQIVGNYIRMLQWDNNFFRTQ